MPQVFVMFSPYAQRVLKEEEETLRLIEEIEQKVTACIMQLWKVPEEDIALSAMNLLYTNHEADVQIEVRYTAGEDEYDLGRPFAPSMNEQIALADAIFTVVAKREFGHGLTFSVWCKPYRESVFKMGPKRGS